VNQLLNTFKQMQQMMRQMSGSKAPRHLKGLLAGGMGLPTPNAGGGPRGAALPGKRPPAIPPGRRGR
jgi:hypothetical protein